MRRQIHRVVILIVSIILIAHCHSPNAAEAPGRKAEIIEIEGKVDVREIAAKAWTPAEIGMELSRGDFIRALDKSYVDMGVEELLAKNVLVRVKEDSMVETEVLPSEVILKMDRGTVIFWAKKVGEELHKFEIRTPNGIVGIEGSVGVLKYDNESGITEGWVRVAGGYVVNLKTGEYTKLEPGNNYLEIKKGETALRKDFRPQQFSNDLRGFRASHAFVIREREAVPGAEEEEEEKYTKEYISGKYKTTVDVSDGEVAFAPYDEGGPNFIEGVILGSGMRADMVSDVGLVMMEAEPEEEVEEEEAAAEEEEEEEESKRKKAEEEEKEDLELEKGIDDSQKDLHQ
jgi:hypothetical protein